MTACKQQWPTDPWTNYYYSVFADEDADSVHFYDEWKVFTRHLVNDDIIGVNLVLLPKWPLDKEDPPSIFISKILAIASFINGEPTGKGKFR